MMKRRTAAAIGAFVLIGALSGLHRPGGEEGAVARAVGSRGPTVATGPTGDYRAAVVGSIHIIPMDAPPVVCNETNHGVIYLQDNVGDDTTLCYCTSSSSWGQNRWLTLGGNTFLGCGAP